MDNTDYKIIDCLSKNGRANASDIADRVNLSTSAVIERMKKLENSGAIKGYTVVLDANKFGKDVTAMMSVAIDHPKYNDNFVAEVMKNHHIAECMYIAGEFDYLLKVVTDNTHALEKILNTIKSIQGVSKTKTNIVLSTPKNEFAVSVRPRKQADTAK